MLLLSPLLFLSLSFPSFFPVFPIIFYKLLSLFFSQYKVAPQNLLMLNCSSLLPLFSSFYLFFQSPLISYYLCFCSSPSDLSVGSFLSPLTIYFFLLSYILKSTQVLIYLLSLSFFRSFHPFHFYFLPVFSSSCLSPLLTICPFDFLSLSFFSSCHSVSPCFCVLHLISSSLCRSLLKVYSSASRPFRPKRQMGFRLISFPTFYLWKVAAAMLPLFLFFLSIFSR